MINKNLARSIALTYLTLVPLLTIALGLGVGYISYKIYLPVWLVNVVLMVLSVNTLGGGKAIRSAHKEQKHLFACACCFIIPTLLTSMFFGLGAPPYESPQTWVQTITEQRVRYYFLLAAGLFVAIGFGLLSRHLKKTGEEFYTVIGSVAMQIAAPVFLLDMSFWGFFLTRLYQQLVNTHTDKTPEWVLPLRIQFYYVNILAAALVYLATAAFALSLKRARWFKPAACNIYLVVCGFLFVLDILPPTLPEPFATLNFIVSIPAVPFMVVYFMGINLVSVAAKQHQ